MIHAILSRIGQLLRAQRTPMIVALDGPSGAGKSTVASALVAATAATVVSGDDFFAAEITAAEWEGRSAAERARDALDWRRLRREAMEPLRARPLRSIS